MFRSMAGRSGGKTVWLSLLGFASVKNASKVFGVGSGEGAFFKKSLPGEWFSFFVWVPLLRFRASKKNSEKFLGWGFGGGSFFQKVPPRKSIFSSFPADKMRADAMGCDRMRPHTMEEKKGGKTDRGVRGRRRGRRETRGGGRQRRRAENGAEPRKPGGLPSPSLNPNNREPLSAPLFLPGAVSAAEAVGKTKSVFRQMSPTASGGGLEWICDVGNDPKPKRKRRSATENR